jgi:acetylornithine deacetylase/succinyl-diaminopimelate desuccinylase-like protein
VTQSALISANHLLSNIDQLVGLSGSPGHAEELAVVAGRVAALMRSSGLTTEVIPTQGPPLVIGRRSGRSPFTLMLYHHYDVAPSGPWRAWHHEPYQMAERDGMLYGRGVAAGKGPLAAHLNALMAIQDADGQLPCEIVVVAEGEGLAGSPNLASALFDYRDRCGPMRAWQQTGSATLKAGRSAMPAPRARSRSGCGRQASPRRSPQG